jgi:hypothetical protein
MHLPKIRECAVMQVGGMGASASAWLGSVGKSAAADAIDLFSSPTKLKRDEQQEQAEIAATRMSFPTAPPASLDAGALLMLQGGGSDADSVASNPGPSAGMTEEDTTEELDSSAAEEFLQYMQKSPEERLRDRILKALGLTEEDVAAMTPDERMGLENKIREIIKETMVKSGGLEGAERERAGDAAIQQQLMLDGI